ncbi:hypothetical protein ABZZ20_25570 [Streptomyces sp. NPDC006430]|uniref:hypothetical protein n=1 Tax=Streptomyces sp. NPDC006430 TaxID=3154299 RepID=UPI0033A5E7B3
MTGSRRAKALPLVLLWAAMTLLMWGGRQLGDTHTPLAICAASCALLLGLGEAADWLRRRIRRRRAARRYPGL